MNKHNYFVIFLKKINLFITNLLKKYLNKLNLSKLAKKKSNIVSSNRVFLSIVLMAITFLSYLSIPYTYNKVEIREELKNQLLDKFGTNFIFSKKFNYNFFPRPHFIIEDSIILKNHINISEVKNLKIYVSLENLFSLKKIKVNDVILENANFNFDQKNYNFFIKLLDNNFSNSMFKVIDSNIFYRNSQKEVLFIDKIIKMKYYYDPHDLQNIIYSKNEIFNIPYTYKLIDNKKKDIIFSKINLNFLKLQIENELNYEGDIKKGSLNLIFNQNKSKATYEFDNDYFIFKFFDKLTNPRFIYEGNINFKPFYSNFKGQADKINLFSLLDSNALFTQFLKTEILNDKNLNIDLSVYANKIDHYYSLVNVVMNSKIHEGLIDINNTKFNWKNYANFEILDSLIYVSENQLLLEGKLMINILNPQEIYKFLLTPKNHRIKIKNIELNFNYNFDQKILNLNDVKVNNLLNQNINDVLKSLTFRDNKLQNKVYFKNVINEAIKSYAG
jgi:hypothetical protein